LSGILSDVNKLDNKSAQSKFTDKTSLYEYNKFAFTENYTNQLSQLFAELNSDKFIIKLEKLTGIYGLVRNNVTLRGAGIHRIENGGHLQLHTDFNTYVHDGLKLDRRINLLIYLNPDWKPEYNGQLLLYDRRQMLCFEKVEPILNRCVIFRHQIKVYMDILFH